MSALPALRYLAKAASEPVRVGVYGATGRLGRMTAPLIARNECSVVIAGRTESRVAELFAQPWCHDAFVLRPSQRPLLREFVDYCRVVVNCAGPLVSADLAWAAIEAGADFIDASDGLLRLPSVRDDVHRFARERAVAVVPQAGLKGLFLGLYGAAVARQARLQAVEVKLDVAPEHVSICAIDQHGRSLQDTSIADAGQHAITAQVIAEATRWALAGDILASGILDWRAFVPELFLEALPFEELRTPVRRAFGFAMPEDILL